MIKFNLKQILKEYGMTQKDLSEVTGIRAGTIGRYCNNEATNISLENLDLICKMIGCTPNDILKFTNEYMPDATIGDTKIEIKHSGLYTDKNYEKDVIPYLFSGVGAINKGFNENKPTQSEEEDSLDTLLMDYFETYIHKKLESKIKQTIDKTIIKYVKDKDKDED